MGVLSCSRMDCRNIMCDTYIDSIGYICDECKEEFKMYLSAKGVSPKKESKILKELALFMEIDKDTYTIENSTNVDDFFEEYTK